VVPRTHDIWIGINRLRQILPRFTFRVPACERGVEAVSNYHTARTTSTGLAVDEPVHDWASHASSALKVIAEAEAAGMLSSAGSTANVRFLAAVPALSIALLSHVGVCPACWPLFCGLMSSLGLTFSSKASICYRS
jgi:hypothetical protein